MDNAEYFDMVQLETSTQCAVHDQTPGSDQKRINIVVRPNYTVEKVISDISIQYPYENFDLVLQPLSQTHGDLVYLNKCRSSLIYKVPGFQPTTKNTLVLLPSGQWDGNTKKRFEFTMPPAKYIPLLNGTGNHMYHNNSNLANNNNGIINDVFLGDGVSSPSTMTVVTNTATSSVTDSLNLSPMSEPEQLSDDDLALGASASPTEIEPSNGGALALGHASPNGSRVKFGPMVEDDTYQHMNLQTAVDRKMDPFYFEERYPLCTLSNPKSSNGYVGLVNQAMTCYLNSLLQALYMTPEFRNALYRWEFDNDNESKNIPYQLQKLFLNLQTSKKPAVETTDLTRSFGWDSTEAWQQHDIQELCRVMFDALEHKFKNTKQANLISHLYEGKMIDYVKCLECNTEKTRADTFLDIPLPVRPFGSTIAYGSIEEALRAFVQPETLDGNNQYFCEKCNKKCDAHKGLKFKNFPYVLTMHLKRFDFDYQTMHRIKLNDKVTFPQTLNLNSFVTCQNNTDANYFTESNASVINAAISSTNFAFSMGGSNSNTDDCSTTDSGSAMEEDCSSGIATTASSSQHENELNYYDEGIEMSSIAEQRKKHESGPYLYELFAIMIHSGSASGGHYYAYIKEFENNEWFCFNDQSVTTITEEDIQKSFGGVSNKAYYTSAYSSSTNAYMLMYRQIDPKRNEHSTKESDFPTHINGLLNKLKSEEETQHCSRFARSTMTSDLHDLIKPRVYFYNPQLKKLKVTRVYVSRSFDVHSILESAYHLLNVDQFAPLERCRLVGYDQTSEEILQSFENVTDAGLTEVRKSCDGTLDFLLEYRAERQEFEIYEPGGSTWYVFMVDLSTMEMDGPYFVYSAAHQCNSILRHSIAVRLHIKESEFLLATLPNHQAFVAYDPAPSNEALEHFQSIAKAQFRHIMYFYMTVPSTDPASLEMIGIPVVDSPKPTIEVTADVVDATCHVLPASEFSSTAHNSCLSTNEYARRESPLPPSSTQHICAGHESNSEDSSLSDGDRTLVETIQSRGEEDSQISSSNHSPQMSSPEEEASQESYNRIHAYFNGSSHISESEALANANLPKFFHAIKIDDESGKSNNSAKKDATSTDEESHKPTTSYKLLVDSHMKYTVFQRHIEVLINVPANYFKIHRKHDSSDPLSSAQTLTLLNEGETLVVELGKELQPDEHKAKLYFMRLNDLDNHTGRLPCICEWIYKSNITVSEAKRDIIGKLHRIDAKYQTLTIKNMRIWLKSGRNPIQILNEDETLANDARLSAPSELLIQECEEGVTPQTSVESVTLFVRRWHPDRLLLDKFQEITLAKDSEMRSTLAQITDIPKDQIAYCKVNSSFPSTNMSLLSINGSMNWFSIPATLEKYPLSSTLSGNIFFYKDESKEPKDLSADERRELNAKEKVRLDRLGCISTANYSPRRERALKIYLDSPQAASTSSVSPMDATYNKASD